MCRIVVIRDGGMSVRVRGGLGMDRLGGVVILGEGRWRGRWCRSGGTIIGEGVGWWRGRGVGLSGVVGEMGRGCRIEEEGCVFIGGEWRR